MMLDLGTDDGGGGGSQPDAHVLFLCICDGTQLPNKCLCVRVAKRMEKRYPKHARLSALYLFCVNQFNLQTLSQAQSNSHLQGRTN